MIVDIVRGDVFKSAYKRIAFGVNTQGYNDAGFAGVVSERFWRKLANTGEKKPLGHVYSNKVEGYELYAMICHSLEKDGWKDTPKALEQCLAKIPHGDPIACVLVGGGPIGQMGGADVLMNMGALARSEHRVVVYTL
jgi:hypothetical protein